MLLCLSASRIYNTLSILIRSRKKKLCICFIAFLIHPSRSPSMMLLCLSTCRIYNTFSISIRSWKKKLGSCSISFVVHPDRSPAMMLLSYYAWVLLGYITSLKFSISIRSRKKNQAVVLYPFWFTQVEVLPWCYYAWALLKYITRLAFLSVAEKKNYAFVLYPFCFTQVEVLPWCYYAWALVGYITRLAFRSVAEKKKLGSGSISFLVHPDRSPAMMLLCLSGSRLYNKSLV